MLFKNEIEARAAWEADRPRYEEAGVILAGVTTYATPALKRDFSLASGLNFGLAFDAQPSLQTTPSGSIPAILTTAIDPDVLRVRFAPTKAAEIFGEVKKGDWLMDTIAFPVVEHAGEVSSYGDYSNNGTTDVNMNWPQRQNYLYQTIEQYGEREVERAALAQIQLVAEKDAAAADVMNRFENYIYFFGVSGLQNYGLLNDPALPAALTPATKTAGGTGWFTTGGAPNATSNEVYNDVLAVFTQLVAQTGGLVTAQDELVLAMSPGSEVGLGFINVYNLKAIDAIKTQFPRLTITTAVQYQKNSAMNPQGNLAGNVMQLIAKTVGGQPTGYCAYSEKMRTHNIVPEMSAWKKKVSGGAWGAVIRVPYAVVTMVGI